MVLSVLFVIPLLSGCGDDQASPEEGYTTGPGDKGQEVHGDTNLISDSPKEGVLRILIWEGYAPEKTVEEFEKEIEAKYGRKIKIEVSLAKIADDFFDAIRDKSVDLVTISHHTIKDKRFHFIDKKLILPFDPKNIPNHVHLIPDLKETDYHTSKGKIYGIPIANGPYGLAYNTEKVAPPPKSWKIFWDPAYKNKYAIGAHEYLYNINVTAMAMGYPRESISRYDVLNNKTFKEKLRQLAENAHTMWVGVDKPDDLLGLSFAASWGDSLSKLKRKGEIWKMADPAEGTMWWIDEYALTWALADRPFMKKVAEEWINKGLSVEFQVDHLVREVGIYPVVTNITDQLTEQEKERIQVSKLPGTFTATRILQYTYSQRDRNGLKLMWDEATKGILPEEKE